MIVVNGERNRYARSVFEGMPNLMAYVGLCDPLHVSHVLVLGNPKINII